MLPPVPEVALVEEFPPSDEMPPVLVPTIEPPEDAPPALDVGLPPVDDEVLVDGFSPVPVDSGAPPVDELPPAAELPLVTVVEEQPISTARTAPRKSFGRPMNFRNIGRIVITSVPRFR
jgi:hypothetical protein